MDLKKTILINRESIKSRVKLLAEKISGDYADKEPVFIGILNGAVFFFADLVRELSIPAKIDFMRAASYGAGMESSGEIRMSKDVELPIEGRDVIVVEDIVDTGLTLKEIVKGLESRAPGSIKTCALINKLERRDVDVNIDYFGFEVEKGFLVGYGLDHDEKYRNLPDIYTVE